MASTRRSSRGSAVSVRTSRSPQASKPLSERLVLQRECSSAPARSVRRPCNASHAMRASPGCSWGQTRRLSTSAARGASLRRPRDAHSMLVMGVASGQDAIVRLRGRRHTTSSTGLTAELLISTTLPSCAIATTGSCMRAGGSSCVERTARLCRWRLFQWSGGSHACRTLRLLSDARQSADGFVMLKSVHAEDSRDLRRYDAASVCRAFLSAIQVRDRTASGSSC
jgi:hypothetical protein